MVGRHAGFSTCQGLIVADRFAADGYEVLSASSCINRYARLVDLQWTLVRRRRAIDVVCLEVYGGPSFVVEDAASRLARALGKRIVMTLHGGALPEFVARHPRWVASVLGRADCLVAPSTFLQRAFASHGYDVRVIPNLIDLSEYEYRYRERLEPRMFWMRAFHHIYNPQLALRVLARVRASIPGASLVMAGPCKGLKADVEQLAHETGLAGAVQFPGFLDAAGKRRAGNATDIFINTSRVDNMPVAIVEACAMGLPVVTTNVGGVPDLLAGGEGVLVGDDDAEAMAGGVLRLLEDRPLAGRLSRAGRQLAERSGWDAVGPMWKGLFEEVLA
jgi:glycosyltransferase involved in cell wall biosynthesis